VGGACYCSRRDLSLEGKRSGSGDGIYSKGKNMQRKVRYGMLYG
jgi:hypothetical protein